MGWQRVGGMAVDGFWVEGGVGVEPEWVGSPCVAFLSWNGTWKMHMHMVRIGNLVEL